MAKPTHGLLVTPAVCLWACAPAHLVDTPDADQAAPADAGYADARDGSVEPPVDGAGDDASVISDGGDGGRSSLDPCGVPDATVYFCPTEATDAGACLGPPLRYGSFTLPPDLIDDASHPVGCTATLRGTSASTARA